MKKLNCYGFHFGERIDLSKVISKVKFDVIKDEEGYLLFQGDSNEYIYVKDFGSIVFIGMELADIKYVCKNIANYQSPISNYPSEEYTILINDNIDIEVGFNEIAVSSFNSDIAHIVMLNIAQAVALDNYQYKTNDLLSQTRRIAKSLELTGNIKMPRRKLRKFVGKTMVLKNRIEENLFIFATSDLAWSDEGLNELDKQLRQELDFVNRHHSLQNSLTVVKENLDLFRDILQHKHSSTLEWIIIILILIEIIQILVDKL